MVKKQPGPVVSSSEFSTKFITVLLKTEDVALLGLCERGCKV